MNACYCTCSTKIEKRETERERTAALSFPKETVSGRVGSRLLKKYRDFISVVLLLG